MTTRPLKDYYDILGVPHNATPEKIKQAYRKLMRENHPDRFTGTRKKYEQSGDPDLLKIIDEKIAQANEKTQEINEAYDMLSDPSKRAAYDRTHGSASASTVSSPPPRPKPEIVLSTINLSFGSVTRGNNKTRSFTIDNHGGMPEEIHVDWETVPTWGELVIEPHPTHTFPIKVTVEVKTGKVAAGSHTGRIVVIVDGEEFGVSVSMKVVIPAPAPTSASSRPTPPPSPRSTPAPAPVYTPPPATPTKIPWGVIIMAVVIFVIVVAAVMSQGQSSQATNIPIPSQIPTLSADQALAAVSGLVHLQNYNLSKTPGGMGGWYNWVKSFQIKNDSNLPIAILQVYWGIETHFDDMWSATWIHDPGWCHDPRGIGWHIKGPTIEFNGSTFNGLSPHSIQSFSCSDNSLPEDIEPENRICVVYYPLVESTYDAIESYSGPAPITICTP